MSNEVLEATAANYFKDRNKQAKTLAERIAEVDDETYGRFSLGKLNKVYTRILRERNVVNKELAETAELQRKLVGTGANGLTAQMNWEMAHKKASTYNDYEFERFKRALVFLLIDKKNKINGKIGWGKSVDSMSQKFFQYADGCIKTIDSAQTPEKLGEYIKVMATNIGNLPLSLNDLLKNMKER